MTDDVFEPLTASLEGHFSKELSELPKDLRTRIKLDFFPMPWRELTEEQRRSVAAQLDYQQDPAMASERERHSDFWTEYDKVKSQIAEWESAATPTATDKATRDDRLKELQERLTTLDGELKRPSGDYVAETASDSVTKKAGQTRSDPMSAEIDEAIRELGNNWTPSQIMRKLKSYAGDAASCITQSKAQSVLWRDTSGKPQELDIEALRKRLGRRPRNAPTTPPTSR